MTDKIGGRNLMLPEPKRNKQELPIEFQLLIRSILALLLFIFGFNLSRSAFFAEYPLFGISYLAEIIISTFAAFIGFFYVPRLVLLAQRAFENFIVTTVTEIVNHFWELQSRKIQEQRRIKQIKKAEEDRIQMVEENKGAVLIDTSALIDGRVLELVRLHFIDTNLIVPQFVIDELHLLSDSKDDLKRKKGRRGLDAIRDLKRKTRVIFPDLRNDGSGVDSLLVGYAKANKVKLLTLDFNLNKVASVNGIKVLNINELANSLKAVMLPGELINVRIVHLGKEKSQGIGYLQDGTMIVVEGASNFVSKDVEAKVTKVIQSPAGKIIFSSLISGIDEPANNSDVEQKLHGNDTMAAVSKFEDSI